MQCNIDTDNLFTGYQLLEVIQEIISNRISRTGRTPSETVIDSLSHRKRKRTIWVAQAIQSSRLTSVKLRVLKRVTPQKTILIKTELSQHKCILLLVATYSASCPSMTSRVVLYVSILKCHATTRENDNPEDDDMER